MTGEEILTEAVAGEVSQRLSDGAAYVRVPAVAPNLPVHGIVTALQELPQDLRIGLFGYDELPDGANVSDDVAEVVQWRDDLGGPRLVIIGDLERNRAAGLASIPTLDVEALRYRILTINEPDVPNQNVR